MSVALKLKQQSSGHSYMTDQLLAGKIPRPYLYGFDYRGLEQLSLCSMKRPFR